MAKHRTTQRLISWESGLLAAVVLLLAWGLSTCIGTDRAATETVTGDYIALFFTVPPVPAGGGMDQDLVALIDRAQEEVVVAAYQLNLASVTDALLRAHAAGVQVRVVTDGSYAGEEAITRLRLAQIPVVARPDSGRGLMHNKFVVVDRTWVWTGSWNLTENGTFRNDNYAVLIASRALASEYAAEFDEMFDGQFGPSSPANTRHRQINVQSDGAIVAQIQVYFAPEDGALTDILAAVDQAESSVRFLAFTFTSQPLADRLIALAGRGVRVEGVVEARSLTATYSQVDRLRAGGVTVLADGNPYAMHSKLIIVDDRTVILGSYNFSASAEQENDENVLIIHDPRVAVAFAAEFDRVVRLAQGHP